MYLKRKWKNEIVLQANEGNLTDSMEGEEMDKIEKIMSLIESVEDEVAEAAILADDGYTDEAREVYAKAVSIKEQIKRMLCELV